VKSTFASILAVTCQRFKNKLKKVNNRKFPKRKRKNIGQEIYKTKNDTDLFQHGRSFELPCVLSTEEASKR
jgi:hypothetical protein